jgi:hypothetical protein
MGQGGEAAGMAPMVSTVADEYGVDVQSDSGYDLLR